MFLDPLSLCLLDGAQAGAASNLYDVGPRLRSAAQACLDAGATPVFVHHTTKGGARQGAGAPDLEDLAFAGVGAFARQWLLVRRRAPYRPGSGRHQLVLAAGGSAGHSGCWHVDVDEGALQEDFSGRRWRATARPAGGDEDGEEGLYLE